MELVTDYSGATAPEFHGLPLISAKDFGSIFDQPFVVNTKYF